MFADKEVFKKYKRDKNIERREFLNEYKTSRGCEKCGFNTHPQALAFDHLDPKTKHPNYSSKQLIRWGINVVMEEILKCRILCHNCHAIHSYESGHHDLYNI